MKHLKKLFPALLALALLTGCGGDRYTLKTTIRVPTGDDAPVTSPAQPISAPAVVTEGREPTETFDLPAEVVDIREWAERSFRRDDMPVGKLIELPEKEVALYGVGVYPAGGSVAWLRWGDALAEFDWTFGGPGMVRPALWCFDADSDGQEEVVAVTCGGTGTGVSIDILHIVEKNEDGDLTDYTFPAELWQDQLSELLDFTVISGTAYAILGEELVDITPQLPVAPEELDGLNTGLICRFDAEYPDSVDIDFDGSVGIDAEEIGGNVYVADISASVSYADGTFTLSNFHLDSIN